MAVLRALVFLEAALLSSVVCASMDEEVRPLDGALQQSAMEAALMQERPDLVQGSTLARRIQAGHLSAHEQGVLQRAAAREIMDTAAADVRMEGQVQAQLREANAIQEKEGRRAQADAKKLIAADSRRVGEAQAEVKAKVEELRRAQKAAPHLVLLQVASTQNPADELEAQAREGAADDAKAAAAAERKEEAKNLLDAALEVEDGMPLDRLKLVHAHNAVAKIANPAAMALRQPAALQSEINSTEAALSSSMAKEASVEQQLNASSANLEVANEQLLKFKNAWEQSEAESQKAKAKSKQLVEETDFAKKDLARPHDPFTAMGTPEIHQHIELYIKKVASSKQKAAAAWHAYQVQEANDPRHENTYKEIIVKEAKRSIVAPKNPINALPMGTVTPIFDEANIAKTRELDEKRRASAPRPTWLKTLNNTVEKLAADTKAPKPEPANVTKVKVDTDVPDPEAVNKDAEEEAEFEKTKAADELPTEAAATKEGKLSKARQAFATTEEPVEPPAQAAETETKLLTHEWPVDDAPPSASEKYEKRTAVQATASGSKSFSARDNGLVSTPQKYDNPSDSIEDPMRSDPPEPTEEKSLDDADPTQKEEKQEVVPESKEPNSLVLLQEVTDTAAQEEETSSEIASKAFSWEQDRQDRATTTVIKQRVALRQRVHRAHQEREQKMSRVTENTHKRMVRNVQLKQVEAKKEKRESWEIAAKAFRTVQQEKAEEDSH